MRRVRDALLAAVTRCQADFIIGEADRPYLLRWWLIPRNRLANVYLHCIRRSDEDRALHDHPWWNVSIILAGGYVEHTISAGGINRRRWRGPGSVVIRRARSAHRLELTFAPECWSLFLTGPRLRAWGFHCPSRWVPWQYSAAPGDKGQIGRGCEEGD